MNFTKYFFKVLKKYGCYFDYLQSLYNNTYFHEFNKTPNSLDYNDDILYGFILWFVLKNKNKYYPVIKYYNNEPICDTEFFILPFMYQIGSTKNNEYMNSVLKNDIQFMKYHDKLILDINHLW